MRTAAIMNRTRLLHTAMTRPALRRASGRRAPALAFALALTLGLGGSPAPWAPADAVAQARAPELRFGGQVPPEVDEIYEAGLAWLARAQNDEGRWTDGQQGPGVNGLCLMAFLASGEDPNFGRYAPVIRRALRSIILDQDAETGYIPNSMYHHGFAMLALAEAYGAVDERLIWQGTGDEEGEQQTRTLGEALEMAVRLAVTSQQNNRFGAWRYSPEAQDADTSVAGAVIMGLLAARNAGLEVPDESIETGLEYIRSNTFRDGTVAYSGGMGMGESMNRSAIAVLVAVVGRQTDTWEYTATLDYIRNRLDHREGGHYLDYFRYYMAQALFQGDYEAWQTWNASTIRQLENARSDDGSFNGSSYSTAMSLLALALNYRFLPVYER